MRASKLLFPHENFKGQINYSQEHHFKRYASRPVGTHAIIQPQGRTQVKAPRLDIVFDNFRGFPHKSFRRQIKL